MSDKSALHSLLSRLFRKHSVSVQIFEISFVMLNPQGVEEGTYAYVMAGNSTLALSLLKTELRSINASLISLIDKPVSLQAETMDDHVRHLWGDLAKCLPRASEFTTHMHKKVFLLPGIQMTGSDLDAR